MAVTSRSVYSNMDNLVNILHRKYDPVLHLEQVRDHVSLQSVDVLLVYVCRLQHDAVTSLCAEVTPLQASSRAVRILCVTASTSLCAHKRQGGGAPMVHGCSLLIVCLASRKHWGWS